MHLNIPLKFYKKKTTYDTSYRDRINLAGFVLRIRSQQVPIKHILRPLEISKAKLLTILYFSLGSLFLAIYTLAM
jgi:hypothetical protein